MNKIISYPMLEFIIDAHHRHDYKYYPNDKHISWRAITLCVEEVGVVYSHSYSQKELAKLRQKTHTKTHKDGWTISAEIHEDYFLWINEFEASHQVYGRVYGDFEKVVYADTQEGYENFISKHSPEYWDYADI